MVCNCYRLLNDLADRSNVFLKWVSGHSSVRSNKRADGLAKLAVKANMIGPEPIFLYSKPTKSLEHTEVLRQAKALINPENAKDERNNPQAELDES